MKYSENGNLRYRKPRRDDLKNESRILPNPLLLAVDFFYLRIKASFFICANERKMISVQTASSTLVFRSWGSTYNLVVEKAETSFSPRKNNTAFL